MNKYKVRIEWKTTDYDAADIIVSAKNRIDALDKASDIAINHEEDLNEYSIGDIVSELTSHFDWNCDLIEEAD